MRVMYYSQAFLRVLVCILVHFVEDQKVRATVLNLWLPLDELKVIKVVAQHLVRVDRATTRSVLLMVASCQDTRRPLMLGKLLHRPATFTDQKSRLRPRRRPDNDRRADPQTGRRASTKGRSWFHRPSSRQNLTNITDIVGMDILARRNAVYIAQPTDVDDLYDVNYM